MCGQINYKLEEFKPFRAQGAALAIFVYGDATIGFDANGQWSVDALEIDFDGVGSIAICEMSELWRPIVSELRRDGGRARKSIEARIRDELAHSHGREYDYHAAAE